MTSPISKGCSGVKENIELCRHYVPFPHESMPRPQKKLPRSAKTERGKYDFQKEIPSPT
jgi:hypothetical protein